MNMPRPTTKNTIENKRSICLGRLLFFLFLLLMTAGCKKQEFNLEIMDASIFDLEFVDYERFIGTDKESLLINSFKISVSDKRDFCLSRDGYNQDFPSLQDKYRNRSAGISVTFNLNYNPDDKRSWGFYEKRAYLKRMYGRKYADDPDNYRDELGRRLINAFGKNVFQKVHFGEIDLDNNRIKNCTVYGIIYGESNFVNKNFNVLFKRKNLTNHSSIHEYTDKIPDYSKEITFDYTHLTLADYSNINNFIASIANAKIERSFNTPYENLFKDFVPSNPKQGAYMLFYESYYAPSLGAAGDVNPKSYGNDHLSSTMNPNEAQLIIYEKYSTRGLGYTMEHYTNGRLTYVVDSYTMIEVEVFDLNTHKIIYTDSFASDKFKNVMDREEIGSKIATLLKKKYQPLKEIKK